MSLTSGDVDFENLRIKFIPKKTSISKETYGYYLKEVFAMIKDQLARNGEKKYLFPDPNYDEIMRKTQIESYYRSGWKRLKKRKKLEGLPPIKIIGLMHTLRAGAITHYVEKGLSLEKIQILSSHSDLKSMSYYDLSGQKFNVSRTHTLLDFL